MLNLWHFIQYTESFGANIYQQSHLKNQMSFCLLFLVWEDFQDDLQIRFLSASAFYNFVLKQKKLTRKMRGETRKKVLFLSYYFIMLAIVI